MKFWHSCVTILLSGSVAACDGSTTSTAAAANDAASTADAATGTDATATDAAVQATVVEVSADILADATWSAGNEYRLKKHIFVRKATLTIEPGVRILGETGSSLVITADAKIHAVGTADKPIVFTSAQPVGSRLPGDWGGVVLLGNAPINVAGGTSKIEGFPAGVEGTTYGGTDPAHDCGKLKYARIEFAGFELAPDNELNALAVAACGSATEIDFVQAHMGSDDGVECFGGTANLKHVIISQCQDDGLDWDFGFVGKVQYLIVQQNSFSNQGFESDNNGKNNDATPRSMPTIYNATLIGSDAEPGKAAQTQIGMHLRRGTGASLYNFVVAHFADLAVDVDGKSTVAQTPASLFVKNSIFFDNGNQAAWVDAKDNDEGFDEGAYFKADATNREVDPMLTAALDQTKPSFVPKAGSPALDASKAATPPSDGFFNASATFVGAVGPTDWTAGWSAFPAN